MTDDNEMNLYTLLHSDKAGVFHIKGCEWTVRFLDRHDCGKLMMGFSSRDDALACFDLLIELDAADAVIERLRGEIAEKEKAHV